MDLQASVVPWRDTWEPFDFKIEKGEAAWDQKPGRQQQQQQQQAAQVIAGRAKASVTVAAASSVGFSQPSASPSKRPAERTGSNGAHGGPEQERGRRARRRQGAASIEVTCPPGAGPGDIIALAGVLPEGQGAVEVEVPEGVGPGEIFSVEVAAASDDDDDGDGDGGGSGGRGDGASLPPAAVEAVSRQAPLLTQSDAHAGSDGEPNSTGSDDELGEAGTLEVTCPEGATPGDVLSLETGDGEQVEVEVPEGIVPGDVFEIQIAASPKRAIDSGDVSSAEDFSDEEGAEAPDPQDSGAGGSDEEEFSDLEEEAVPVPAPAPASPLGQSPASPAKFSGNKKLPRRPDAPPPNSPQSTAAAKKRVPPRPPGARPPPASLKKPATVVQSSDEEFSDDEGGTALPDGWTSGKMGNGTEFWFRASNPSEVQWTRPTA